MDQIEGLLPPKECQQNKTVSSCEQLIENMTNKPAIVTMNGSKCGYSPQKDAIFMVNKNQFESLFEYYHVLFHELIHATGHQSRLNRNTITKKILLDHLNTPLKNESQKLVIYPIWPIFKKK